MDSQLAAFEKFKASGSGKNFTRESRNSDGPSSAMDGPAPDLYSIHHGKVVRVEGKLRHGLVHKTQASRHFTQHVSDVVAVGDQVWVKVISLQDDKIALSMKYVSQGDGTDLDTNLVQLTEAADKRRVHTGFMDKAPISIEEGGVLLKTVCKKCGAAGHLAAECFSGGEKFELLADDDEDDNDNRYAARVRSSDKEKKKKDKDRDRESRRDRKEKKESSSHKKEKKRGRSRSASPKRRLDDHRGSKVESVEDALAVMRAHKIGVA
ncbi:Nucleolar protein of 40 kDa [Dissophora globulifera]|uniref:Nucleolar protein of 40 kDa n=1 Tax=Dissophora globulifera TaxID=979702 RepID=A0A9P6RXL3_9FUNG|nr:Nucleolar protein of 40 kDa [Dissophora globulifera]